MKQNPENQFIGAFVGDIVGSIYEFHNHRSKEFPLFSEGCMVTDDSIMTLGVAKALMICRPDHSDLAECAAAAMREVGQPYPQCGYGGRFLDWMYTPDPRPYNSFGNGAAMRVSAVAYAAKTMEEVREFSRAVTGVTHNHPEGLKGAEATAAATFMALHGADKAEILAKMESYYTLDFTLDGIRDTYRFNETCQETVPQAIVCFREAADFEDTIRNAISIGGDSDTLGAIAGAISGAYYGVPEESTGQARTYMDPNLTEIFDSFISFVSGPQA